MQPLAFIATEIEEREARLTACAASEIIPEAWDEFAACVALEPTLISYPSSVFRARWEQGHAAVAACAGHIVSYTSLVTVFDTAFRRKLAAIWPQVGGCLPPIDLYESATAWTHPHWRRHGISLALRGPLLQRFCEPHILCVAVGVGLGSAPVLSKLGWSVLSWHEIPYLSSLIAVPLAGYEAQVGPGWLMPGDLRLYEGKPTFFGNGSCHEWKQFYHFWAARNPLAQRLNAGLRDGTGGDLCRWRDAIVQTHVTSPMPFWKLSFYKE
jgi:hypothetical protein